MTDRDGFYSNYWHKQRSANLQSDANDLIMYFRTAQAALTLKKKKKKIRPMKNKIQSDSGWSGFGWIYDSKERDV